MKPSIIKAICSLKEFQLSRQLNILLLGYSGTGKSSLINTIHLHDKEYIDLVADVRENPEDQCTVTFQGYRFNEYVVCYDTCGLAKINNVVNYTQDAFRNMLDGKVKVGEKIQENGTFKSVDIDPTRVIDIVVFVFDEERLEKEMLSDMKQFFEIASVKGKKCFGVVTKVDASLKKEKGVALITLEPKNAFNLVIGSECWRKAKVAIKKGISMKLSRQTFPIMNYNAEESNTHDVVKYICGRFLGAITRDIATPGGVSIPFKVDLFEGEDTNELTFLRNVPNLPSRLTSSKINKDEYLKEAKEVKNLQTRNFIVPKIFYRCLKLGERLFRFFLVSSILHPTTQVIGAFCRKDFNSSEMIYFQTTSSDLKLANRLEVVFREIHKGYFEFLSQNGSYIDPKGCKFLRVLLKNEKPLEMRKEYFSDYTGFIEHSIQLIKKNTILDQKISDSLQKTKEAVKGIRPAIETIENELKTKFSVFQHNITQECKIVAQSIPMLEQKIKDSKDSVVGEVNKKIMSLTKIIEKLSQNVEALENCKNDLDKVEKIFAVGTDNAIYDRDFNGNSTWKRFSDPNIRCIQYSKIRKSIFGIGSNNDVYEISTKPGSKWIKNADPWVKNITLCEENGVCIIFGAGKDNALYRRNADSKGKGWEKWASGSVTFLSSDGVYVYGVGLDNRIYKVDVRGKNNSWKVCSVSWVRSVLFHKGYLYGIGRVFGVYRVKDIVIYNDKLYGVGKSGCVHVATLDPSDKKWRKITGGTVLDICIGK